MTASEAAQRVDDSLFEPVRAVADAILYEGYVLYPYRASAGKNQVRWQFGVLMPPRYVESEPSERHGFQTECLLEPGEETVVRVRVRYLQVQAKRVEERHQGAFRPVPSIESDGGLLVTWDEALERVVDAEASLDELLEGPRVVGFAVPADRQEEPVQGPGGNAVGRVVREREALAGAIRLRAERLDGPFGVVRLHLAVENLTRTAPAGRDEAIRGALVSAHAFVALTEGTFVSLLEPPEWARPAAGSCANDGIFPVLVGDRDRPALMLCSPIILYDFPEVAPESPGDLFDATEIDEILSLRTLALTEEEKREARATDPRAAAVIDRVDAMPQELLDKPPRRGPLPATGHRGGTAGGGRTSARGRQALVGPGRRMLPSRPRPTTCWWTGSPWPGAAGFCCGRRCAASDAQDMFLDGRAARVEAVLLDVDGGEHLAVVLEEDPAADLLGEEGRFLYFSPEEVESLDRPGEPS